MCDFTYIISNDLVIYSYIHCEQPYSHTNPESYWYESFDSINLDEVGEGNIFTLCDSSKINKKGIPYHSESIILDGKIYEAKFCEYVNFLKYKRRLVIDSII